MFHRFFGASIKPLHPPFTSRIKCAIPSTRTFTPHHIFMMKSSMTTTPRQTHRSPPPTTTQKRYNRGGGDDEPDPAEYIKSPRTRSRDELPGPAPLRPTDRDLPPHMRTPGNWFRRGLDIPRISRSHWMNVMVVQPYIALRGHYYTWVDSNVRFSRKGFYLFHAVGLSLGLYLGYLSSEFVWGDVQEQLDVSQELYLLDVAILLWIRQAMRNCELVIDKRPGGIIPGLTLPEALAAEKERQFALADSPTVDIIERAKQLDEFYKQQEHNVRALHPNQQPEKSKEQLLQEKRKFMAPYELQQEFEEMTRKEDFFSRKREFTLSREQQLAEDRKSLQSNVQQSKQNFRQQYILQYVQKPDV